jgi:hypothetical protein
MKKEKKSKVKHIQSKIEKKKKKNRKQPPYQQPTKRKSTTIHQNCTKETKEDGEKEKKKAQLRGAFQFNMNFLRMKNLNSSITSLFDSSSGLISKITSISICIIL